MTTNMKSTGTLHSKAGLVEYTMSDMMARELLKDAKIKDGPTSKRGQEYLCKVVDENFGLLGACTQVLVK